MTYIPPSLKKISDLVGKKTTKISRWMGHQKSIQYAAQQAAIHSTTSAPHDLKKHDALKPVLEKLVEIDRGTGHYLQRSIQQGGLSTSQRMSTAHKIGQVLEEREKDKYEKLIHEKKLDELKNKPADMDEDKFKKKVEAAKKEKFHLKDKLEHELHQEKEDVTKLLGAMRHRYVPKEQIIDPHRRVSVTSGQKTTQVFQTGATATVFTSGNQTQVRAPGAAKGPAHSAADLANIKKNTTPPGQKPSGIMLE